MLFYLDLLKQSPTSPLVKDYFQAQTWWVQNLQAHVGRCVPEYWPYMPIIAITTATIGYIPTTIYLFILQINGPYKAYFHFVKELTKWVMNQFSGIFSAAAMTTQRTIHFFCKTGLVIQIRYPCFNKFLDIQCKYLDVKLKHYPIIQFVLDSVTVELFEEQYRN